MPPLALVLLLLCPQLKGQYSLSPKQNLRDGYVNVFELSKGGTKYGNAIWMDRSASGKRIKAKYFASGDTYQKFLNWKGNKDIIMVSSGAYSSGMNGRYSIPVGICVDNGEIVNRNIDHKMDGLVIVEAVGGVRVSDVEKGNLYLGSLGKRVSPIKDKLVLLNWGREESATIFQTHLLAYDNKLRTYSNGDAKRASRGMLALVTDKKDNVMHIVFEIDREVSLYEAAKDALSTLKKRNLEVVGLMNLDRGAYDIMEAYNDNSQSMSFLSGSVSVSNATNLLVYYYE
jgi:hypothetical protein